MKAVDFLKRLEAKDFFKEFKKENPEMLLCAFFCILEKEETQGDKIHIDYFLPSKKKIVYSESPFQTISFSQDEGKEINELKNLGAIKVDLEDLWDIIEEVKKDRKTVHNTGKIIAVLTSEGWNLTCLSPTLDLLKIKINPWNKEIKEFKKEGLSDIIKFKTKK